MKIRQLLIMFLILPCFLLIACGTINVSGKTFRYEKVTIDWGTAG